MVGLCPKSEQLIAIGAPEVIVDEVAPVEPAWQKSERRAVVTYTEIRQCAIAHLLVGQFDCSFQIGWELDLQLDRLAGRAAHGFLNRTPSSSTAGVETPIQTGALPAAGWSALFGLVVHYSDGTCVSETKLP